MSDKNISRRGVLKAGAVGGAALATPTLLTNPALTAAHAGYTNAPPTTPRVRTSGPTASVTSSTPTCLAPRLAPVLKNNYGTDRRLPPDRRLQLGLVTGRLDQEVH